MNIWTHGENKQIAAFDGPDEKGKIQCSIRFRPRLFPVYEEWESTLRICGRPRPHTKIHTHMIGNNAYMGLFCIRFEVKRWHPR